MSDALTDREVEAVWLALDSEDGISPDMLELFRQHYDALAAERRADIERIAVLTEALAPFAVAYDRECKSWQSPPPLDRVALDNLHIDDFKRASDALTTPAPKEASDG